MKGSATPILILVLVNLSIFVLVFFKPPPSHLLRVSVLNIGQGDSILVQGPTGLTMLVDGGPDHSVTRDLGMKLGPLNRHLDLVVETHPDADHITGLLYVLQNYSVSNFMTPAIPHDTQIFQKIENEANAHPNMKRITARRGIRLDLGGGAYADILHPDRDMSKETETNDGSTTMHIVYGSTSFMLTGDLPTTVENWLVMLDGEDGELKTDVLKVGHHGSKFSSGDPWLAALNPTYAAISVGKENRYGHPSVDAIQRIKSQGAKILTTEDLGTITFESNGKTLTEHAEGL